jgi:hypothetical protein
MVTDVVVSIGCEEVVVRLLSPFCFGPRIVHVMTLGISFQKARYSNFTLHRVATMTLQIHSEADTSTR